jgi:hypothetical protein
MRGKSNKETVGVHSVLEHSIEIGRNNWKVLPRFRKLWEMDGK